MIDEPWEKCLNLNRPSWGYNTQQNPLSPEEIIRMLVDVVGRGRNVLLNVGPDANGEIPPAHVAVLNQVGDWLARNGQVVPQNPKLHAQVELKFLPIGDGLTFKLTGTFLDTVPEGRPERWSGLAKGSPIGHATGGGPVTIHRICGRAGLLRGPLRPGGDYRPLVALDHDPAAREVPGDRHGCCVAVGAVQRAEVEERRPGGAYLLDHSPGRALVGHELYRWRANGRCGTG